MRAPVARDRTKSEHVACVRGVRWKAEDDSFVILDLADGYTAHGAAAAGSFLPGTLYRFMGRWKNSDRWGDQFHFTSFAIHGFSGRAGVVAYLTKTCEGIGERTADKLWSQYGGLAVQVLREQPDQVVADGLLREDIARAAAQDLESEKHLERTRIDLFGLLNGRGFHGKLLNQAISKWGVKAPEMIRRDPFKLLGMAGAGFKRCDRLWRELGLPLDRLKRQLYAALNEIGNDRDGHTWLPAVRAAECVVNAVGEGARPKQALLLGRRAGKLRARKDADGGVWVALAARAEAERRIADGIRRLCATGRVEWPTNIPVSQADGDGLPSAHQVEELRKATAAAVGCLIGGPGTGKSHSVAFLIRSAVQRVGPDNVAVCAPTGKAAVRMTQALAAAGIDLRATTIHQLLEIGRNGHDGAGWGFLRNRDNPLDQRYVFADETSMQDTGLMADLFDACQGGLYLPAQPEIRVAAGETIPARCRRCGRVLTTPESRAIGYGPECARRVSPMDYRPACGELATEEVVIPALPEVRSAGTHLLFIGDPHQLPPVGHGAPLRDLIAAGVATGELTEVRRNAGRIVFACRDIKANRPAEFSPRIDLEAAEPENLRLVECKAAETADVVVDLLSRGIRGFHPVWETQVIVALNEKGACNRVDLNGRLQKLLNPAGQEAPKQRFRAGDKIICLRNGWLRPCFPRRDGMQPDQEADAGNYQDLPGGGNEVYCANGEIGRVVAVAEKSIVCRFGESPTLVRVGTVRDKADDGSGGDASDFDLGYAVTGHKMQGSQAPCVVIVADSAAASVAAREWWYTSLSRASKLCVVVGARETFSAQAAKVTLVRRKTFLAETIREAAHAN